MHVLALDSSANACSVALVRDGAVLARRLAVMERGQSEVLLPMVADVLGEAGLGGGDLDLLAVTVGPGAFTGIRIGLAAVRGLALAWGLPVAGVTSPQAVAAGVAGRGDTPVVVVMDSKRADLWVQMFDAALEPLGEPKSLALSEIAAFAPPGSLILAGDAKDRLAPLLPGARLAIGPDHIDAVHVARLAVAAWAQGRALGPEPLYLRPADVTLPKS